MKSTRALRKSATVLSVMIVACILSVVSAGAAPLYTLSGDDPYRNNSWSFGERFTVGSQNVTVTALGAYDDYANGFVTPGGIPVGLYRESDQALLASTTVVSSDPLSGFFRFGSISPVTLLSGVQYRVVAVNRDDKYNVTQYTYSFSPLVTYDGYGYVQSTTLAFGNTFTGTERTWMANLELNGNPVPIPPSLLLLGPGLAGLAAVKRRFKR